MDFSDGFLLLRKQKIIHLGCNPSKLKLCILSAGFPFLQKRKKIHLSPKSIENIDGFRDPSERKQALREVSDTSAAGKGDRTFADQCSLSNQCREGCANAEAAK